MNREEELREHLTLASQSIMSARLLLSNRDDASDDASDDAKHWDKLKAAWDLVFEVRCARGLFKVES